jgi:hypothetical protein
MTLFDFVQQQQKDKKVLTATPAAVLSTAQ